MGRLQVKIMCPSRAKMGRLQVKIMCPSRAELGRLQVKIMCPSREKLGRLQVKIMCPSRATWTQGCRSWEDKFFKKRLGKTTANNFFYIKLISYHGRNKCSITQHKLG